jgi:SsrA-binding protein
MVAVVSRQSRYQIPDTSDRLTDGAGSLATGNLSRQTPIQPTRFPTLPLHSTSTKLIVSNRKARYEYQVLDTYEAGLVLQGTEVKSLRQGRANLQDAFARFDGGELWLFNLHISPYEPGNRFNHDPLRPRKLLLNRRELRKLVGQVEQKGLTLVPLDLHFRGGIAKVNLALARGKKLHDKRDDVRKRDAEREIARGYKDA